MTTFKTQFNVVSSDNGTYKAITAISVAGLEYRTFRKGTFGWALDKYVRELPKESKDEDLAHAFFTGTDRATGSPLADNTIIKDKIELVLIGVNRYNNVKFSEQYAANDYQEVIGFNMCAGADSSGLIGVTSFIVPIGNWEDPIGNMVNEMYSAAFKDYYQSSGSTDGFEFSEQYKLALIKPVRFGIEKRKTNFGMIGYVKPTVIASTPETTELASLAYNWLEANGGEPPVNQRYLQKREEETKFNILALDADNAPY